MTDHILYILYLIHTYTPALHCTREHLVAVALDCRLPGIKFPPYDLFSMWWYCLVAESCPTLCDPMDYNPSGFSVRGVSQARILEWVQKYEIRHYCKQIYVSKMHNLEAMDIFLEKYNLP